jgi:hypothetical protein
MAKKSNPLSFQDLTTEINQTREELRQSKTDLNQARVDKQTIVKELNSTSRNSDPERIADLEQLHLSNEERVTNVHSLVDSNATRVGKLISTLVSQIDPRAAVENLSDGTPVLLLPIRIETRFMIVKHVVRVEPVKSAGGTKGTTFTARESQVLNQSLPVIEDKKQLWIRIFPDDIHVHTHEPALTELELNAGIQFWTNVWSHLGSESATGYVEAEIGLWRALISGRTTERAAWIARVTMPTNMGSAGSGSPIFPTTFDMKLSSWTEAPHTRVLPDSFVARLYNGATWREVLGKGIPDPLQLNIDPNEPETSYDRTNGDLKLPATLRWLEDFKEAEKVGMGIRVDISDDESRNGFDKILVLGIKSSANKTQAQALLEELIENHHYTSGGFALVPQGTATNNTSDVASGFTAYDDDAVVSYLTEMKGNLFTTDTNDRKKQDGQHLAEALGINYDVLGHIRYSDSWDIKEAMCMNRALWPTTMGYYLKQMMHPLLDKPTIKKTREHFTQFVLGRGRVPSIRVDHQPYGIQPATAFARWKYSGNNDRVQYLTGLHDDLLSRMAVTWKLLVNQVQHAGSSSFLPPEKFLAMITLHPASIEYYQRFSGGKWFLWNLFTFSQRVAGSALDGNITYLEALPADLATRFAALGLFTSGGPRLFDFSFLKEEKYLKGPVIDPLPLSESRRINQIAATGKNYIEWLIASTYTQVRNEDFTNIGAPANTAPPVALLYLMLRQSCLLEIVQTAVSVLISEELLSPEAAIDYELINVGSSIGSITAEQDALLRTSIEAELSSPHEAALRTQVNQEFSASKLEPSRLETEKSVRLNQLRSAESGVLTQRIENEYQRRVAEFEVAPSKSDLLTETYEGLTNGQTLETYIGTLNANLLEELAEMQEVKDSLECLKHIPTARLERTFAETLDVCNYRLDSWMYSLVTERLNQQRVGQPSRETGIYLGGFGWIENLLPSQFPGISVEEVVVSTNTTTTTVVVVSEEQVSIRLGDKTATTTTAKTTTSTSKTPTSNSKTTSKIPPLTELAPGEKVVEFASVVLVDTKGIFTTAFPVQYSLAVEPPRFIYLGRNGSSMLVYDPVQDKFVGRAAVNPENQGYIHAPSINQATAAGILRAGYNSHASIGSSAPDNKMAVNLSSARMRKAMFYIEGIRNGQELAALLGYQFERNLHDNYTSMDEYIYDLRTIYPLVVGRVTSVSGMTQVGEGESYNVIDGLALVDAYRKSLVLGGPVWHNTQPPLDPITPLPAGVIIDMEKEIAALEDALDAISDLLLAESVFQASQGNAVRAGSTLEALAKGLGLQELEILRTPRTSETITQKVGIQFDLIPGGAIAWSATATSRSSAEPHLNRWIASLFPAIAKVCVNIQYTPNTPPASPSILEKITMAQLGIEAIDLYYMIADATEPGSYSELSARLGFALRSLVINSDDISGVEVKYVSRTGFTSDEVSIFELTPLINSIKELLLKSKALSGEDLLLNSIAESDKANNPTKGVQPANLEARLINVPATMTALANNIKAIIINYSLNAATLTPAVLNTLRGYLLETGLYNIPNAVPHAGFDFSTAIIEETIEYASRVRPVLQNKSEKAQDLLDNLGITVGNERIAKLEEVAKAIFGRSFRVFPEFLQYAEVEFERAKANPDYLDVAQVGDFPIEEWIQSVAKVRKPIAALQRADVLSEALKGSGFLNLEISQLPLVTLTTETTYRDRWLGAKFDVEYEIPGDNLSTLFQYPSSYDYAGLQAGILIDEWVEEIPLERATTGIALNYNNPDTEAPQSMLLCVTPEETGRWNWNVLMDILNETLEWAKVRAVDPDLLKTTPYAHMLPALIASISGNGSTPSLDFGRNNLGTPIRVVGPVLMEAVADEINYEA